MSVNKPVQLGLCCMNMTLKKQKPPVYASRKIIVRIIDQKGIEELKKRVNTSGCLNRCKKGPLMVIYPEGIWLKVTNKQDIDLIVEKYIKENKISKKLLISN